MKYEFHAQYPLASQESSIQAKAIDWLVGREYQPPKGWDELAEVRDEGARIRLLTQAVGTSYKEQARMGSRRKAGGFRYWLEERAGEFLKERFRLLEGLGLVPTMPTMESLPPCSWAMSFTFTLRRPYLSRDDTDWYILDNPVRKDKVFGLPLVAPTAWKGMLRAAMRQEKGYTSWEEEQKDDQMVYLFGNVKEEEREEAFRSGRLHFYPTFFTQLGLEVINPQDRKTGSGTQPIYIECVPAGTRGTFCLLYVPFDLVGSEDEDEIRRKAKADLKLVAHGVSAMMLTYGFSAKRTSGYGTVEDEIEGSVRTKAGEWPLTRLSRLRQEVGDVEF